MGLLFLYLCVMMHGNMNIKHVGVNIMCMYLYVQGVGLIA